MPNTYTQLYIHSVFAVKYRAAVISPEWDERLRQYVTGVVQNHGHKMLAINNVYDHMHFLVGLNPNQSVSDMMRTVKSESSEWINKEKMTKRKFYLQHGFGAFTHSKSQISQVAAYIENQKEHHKKVAFSDEYKKMLTDFGVDYDERYIFSELED